MKSQSTIYPVKRILLILICFVISIPVYSQRVFAVSETGMVQEVKKGEITKKAGIAKGASLKKNRPSIIPNPLRFYIYIDSEFDPEEWYIQQMIQFNNTGPSFICNGTNKKGFRKLATFNRINENIVEIELDNNILKPIGSNANMIANGFSIPYLGDLAIVYDPSKKNKKAGKDQMYWFVRLSQNDYDTDDVNWTQSQVEYSINEIIATKNTTKHLFASIVPQQTVPQYQNQNGNIQYVVVQQPQQVVQNVSTKDQPKEDIIESDIDANIPYNSTKSENTFALVIANEDYTKVPTVQFAKRDGKIVSDYIKRTLGVDKSHVTLIENATLNDMKYELKRLAQITEAYNGESNIIVYYCGHGIPDEKNGNGYLLPIDGYGNDVSTAYSLDELYSQLGKLNAKKTILVTDACFSGANKSGDMLVSARGVAMRAKSNQATGNLIAFSACQGDETAYSYDEKGHGLLTYYFLKKLQETGGKTTLGELEEYIVDNVGKTAIVINGKSQTPKVSVSPELKDTWREQTLVE